MRAGIPTLRAARFVAEFRRSLREISDRTDFRVVHYSIQANHVHLVVESAGKEALGRGMKAVSARVARAIQRVFRRAGPVMYGRYHLHVLRTPREIRSALAYVLLNARKHWRERHGASPPVQLDAASSGRWFDGWRELPPSSEAMPGLLEASDSPEVARPRTWLLGHGWRRHGLIDPAEVPGSGKAC